MIPRAASSTGTYRLPRLGRTPIPPLSPNLISMQEGWKALDGGTGAREHLLVSCRLLPGALAPWLLHVAPAADLSAPLPAPRLPRAFAPFPREGTGWRCVRTVGISSTLPRRREEKMA